MSAWCDRQVRPRASLRDGLTIEDPRPRLAGGIALVLVALPALADVPGSPEPIVPRDALVLTGTGRDGRRPIPIDPVVEQVIAGTWTAPKAGDTVPVADGRDRAWVPLKAGDDGTFRAPGLSGGYAAITVPSDADRVLMLEAAGHTLVYVNGVPRVGDPYSHGYVHLPIALRSGDNHLLFAVGRGALRVRLTAPQAPAYLDPSDPTLPDLSAGGETDTWGAVIAVNASDRLLDGLSLRAAIDDGEPLATGPVAIPPLATRKIPLRLRGRAPAEGDSARVAITLLRGDEAIDSAEVSLRVRRPDRTQKRTFLSRIDGSVQYYGLVPASGEESRPGLILTLHGAGVEGIGQAEVYAPKPWAHVVAPTNRRPYGFDWEDWGRLDAIEVLDHALKELGADPSRVVLTGHSMGGHGTWYLGATFPDRFAAIAPSAGWISMFSYAGARRAEDPTPRQALLQRAASPSDTLALERNYAGLGVYVLHGDADNNVPVDQAREMRRRLGRFHPDFAYYERPGAGHWWGNECCDWPPLIDFLSRRRIPGAADVRRLEFTTASPGVSSRAHWATIEDQLKRLEPSTIRLTCDPDRRRFAGSTENVARLALDLGHLKPGAAVTAELDGQSVELPRPEEAPRVWLGRAEGQWSRIEEPPPSRKGPRRYGSFKDAFRNRFQLIYGTRGTAEENAWSLARARLDAETFWYRGNGSVEVLPDTAFDPAAEPDRNVILYGNADTHAAWPGLLADSPVQLRRGGAKVGDREATGEAIACLLIRPRPGSGRASVGVVGGTGLAGMRRTDRLPYFVAGVSYPDLTLLDGGPDPILCTGYFDGDWGVTSGEIAWRD
jgi:poly(3-hydroxybutyrate) depolymerase